jgi:transcriptional regulator with XRE-family HTH domain
MQGSNNNGKELTRRQEQALLALMDGASLSLADVARKISVNPSTLWRWLNRDEAFMRRYRDLRRAHVERGVARIQSLFDEAVSCLERNLNSGNRPSEVRSALGIIRQSLEGVDAMDYDTRIRAIEARFEK